MRPRSVDGRSPPVCSHFRRSASSLPSIPCRSFCRRFSSDRSGIPLASRPTVGRRRGWTKSSRPCALCRPSPAAVVALGLGVTISAGTWIAAVPEYVRAVLHREAGGVSILMVGYAGGSIAVGALLARVPVENKARASLLAWMLYLPAYGLFLATSVLDGGSRSFPCRIRPDRLGDSPDFSRRKKSDPTCWDA